MPRTGRAVWEGRGGKHTHGVGGLVVSLCELRVGVAG